MRKVMLVDDEFMLLRGLQLLINWQDLGLEIVNTEQNPLVALDYLRTNSIDILLSDMNMPEMKGPEFVAKAKALQPDMELVVISGYSDFDYVRAGLQQNAVNYLRKPIDTDELVETLQGALARIDARQQSSRNASLAVQTQARSLLTASQPKHIAQLADSLRLRFGDTDAPVRLIGVLNPLPPTDLTDYLSLTETVHGYYQEDNDYVILFQGTNTQLNDFIDGAPHQVGAQRRPFLIGAPVVAPMQLRTNAEILRREIRRQYFFETAAGLRIMLPDCQKLKPQTLPGYSTVRQVIDDLNVTEFADWVHGQFATMKKENASDILARQFALIVLLVLSDRLTDFSDKAAVIADINAAEDVTTLRRILVHIAELAVAGSQQQFSRNVAAMRAIVEKRYAEPLSLAMIASELHLSAVYLGQLFKQEAGRSFAQYLNDYRVGVAVDMLRNTQADVSEIAQAVGYQNPSYFYKLFKQQTGMSPREYREAGIIHS